MLDSMCSVIVLAKKVDLPLCQRHVGNKHVSQENIDSWLRRQLRDEFFSGFHSDSLRRFAQLPDGVGANNQTCVGFSPKNN